RLARARGPQALGGESLLLSNADSRQRRADLVQSRRQRLPTRVAPATRRPRWRRERRKARRARAVATARARRRPELPGPRGATRTAARRQAHLRRVRRARTTLGLVDCRGCFADRMLRANIDAGARCCLATALPVGAERSLGLLPEPPRPGAG